jgi:hypothetical protein
MEDHFARRPLRGGGGFGWFGSRCDLTGFAGQPSKQDSLRVVERGRQAWKSLRNDETFERT